jgi:hypothetical protein
MSIETFIVDSSQPLIFNFLPSLCRAMFLALVIPQVLPANIVTNAKRFGQLLKRWMTIFSYTEVHLNSS